MEDPNYIPWSVIIIARTLKYGTPSRHRAPRLGKNVFKRLRESIDDCWVFSETVQVSQSVDDFETDYVKTLSGTRGNMPTSFLICFAILNF